MRIGKPLHPDFGIEIEDVDLAEAITKLNADQTAVEAATRVLGSLNQFVHTKIALFYLHPPRCCQLQNRVSGNSMQKAGI